MTDVQFHRLSMLFYLVFALCMLVIVLFTFRITAVREKQIGSQIRTEMSNNQELIEAPEPQSPYQPLPLPPMAIERSTFIEFLELNPTLAVPKSLRE